MPGLLLVSTMSVLGQGRALACSGAPHSPAEYARGADAIFTGRVTAVSTTVSITTAAFRVDTVCRGSTDRQRIVETPGQGGGCGVSFLEGDRYTVFASVDHSGRWQTIQCSGNVWGVISALAYGLSPTPIPSHPPTAAADSTPTPHRGGSTWNWIVVTGVGLAMFGVGFVLGRRRPT